MFPYVTQACRTASINPFRACAAIHAGRSAEPCRLIRFCTDAWGIFTSVSPPHHLYVQFCFSSEMGNDCRH